MIFLVTDLAINLGISGDHVENLLWRARDVPSSLKNVVILCGTNNINKDSPYDIAQGLIAIGSVFKNRSSHPNIYLWITHSCYGWKWHFLAKKHYTI